MDAHLRTLLAANQVHQDVVAWLESADAMCLSIKTFANWCDDPLGVQANILDHVPSCKTCRSQYAALKQAWKEAAAANSRSLRGAAEGLNDDNLDDPSPEPTQESVENTFTAYYKFPVDPKKFGSDAILGRIQREFVRHQPSMLALTRARTVTTCMRATPGKRQKLAESLFIMIEDDPPAAKELDESRLRYRLGQYKVLCDTWALAGCFTYPSNAHPDELYCHWAESTAYHELLCEKVWPLTDN